MITPEHRTIIRHGMKSQWILLVICLVFIGLFNILYLFRLYESTSQHESKRLSNLALAIDKNISFNLESINQVLIQILTEIPSIRNGDYLTLSSRMKTLSDAMAGVRTMIMADASGRIVASNRNDLLGVNIRERDYFKIPRGKQDPSKLYISEPFTTFSGYYVMNLTRIISRSGEFSGIISAALDPDYFKIVMSSVLYAPDMWSAMAHGGGVQFLMVPDRLGQRGKNLAQEGSFFSRHRDSGLAENVISGKVYATGEERIMAIRTISPPDLRMNQPVIIAVGREKEALYADWKREMVMQALLFVIISAVSTAFLRFYQRRQSEGASRLLEAAEKLRASEEMCQLIAENTSDVVWNLDLGTRRFTYVSPSVFRLRGFTPEEVMSQPFDASLTPGSLQLVDSFIRSSIEEMLAGKYENMHGVTQVEQPRKDGTTVWTEVATTYLLDGAGRPVSVVGISRDISERKKEEDVIRSSLLEKEVLIREIHHRVKNNMNIISSLLSLQEENIRDENILRIFRESQQRIRSISLVHEELYRSKSLKKIDFYQYISVIINELLSSMHNNKSGIVVAVDTGGIELDVDRAVPCGLIVNELVTNSIKYAFGKSGEGRLSVTLAGSGESLVLTVKDTGPGLPLGFNLSSVTTLGLQLVGLLARQMKGEFSISSSGGTAAVVTFPRGPGAERSRGAVNRPEPA